MTKSPKTAYVCQQCGYKAPQWMGRCPDCQQWDTLVEEKIETVGPGARGGRRRSSSASQPVALTDVAADREPRLSTAIGEFDRVLGGGLVRGSLVLVGGDPGIGKSTLMLQVLHGLAVDRARVLYLTGEESLQQLKMRSQRLKANAGGLRVAAETDMDAILLMIGRERPDVVVIDSIQTMYNPEIASAPGSVSQVRESAVKLMTTAKTTGVSIFIVGHVTKEGAIAGPRLLEHMVDTVLYFEGDRNQIFRILRAVKNRFGSTNEIGVFEMKADGLQQVPNPSAVFLAERPEHAPGSVVTASMEGTRPILIELQALASGTSFASPRRTILGLDANRVALLAAVMEKKLGLHLAGHDIFMNVAGGVKVVEPAVDLSIVAAIASSFLDRPLPERTVVFGEVGLTGEVRAISHVDVRLAEIHKMGFRRCLLPSSNVKRSLAPKKLELLSVKTLNQAVELLF